MHTRRAWMGPLGVALALAAAVAVVVWAYTPVEDREVVNDTTDQVVIYGCSSDPVELRAGAMGPVQVNTGPPVSCDVETESGSREHWCLYVAHGVRARVSCARPVPQGHSNCGG